MRRRKNTFLHTCFRSPFFQRGLNYLFSFHYRTLRIPRSKRRTYRWRNAWCRLKSYNVASYIILSRTYRPNGPSSVRRKSTVGGYECLSEVGFWYPRSLFDTPYDFIVALDALGFVLGGAVANAEGKGLVTVRKGNKLPLEDDRKASVTFEDHDGEKTMEVRKDLVKVNSRILLIDEWIGTGAQIKHVTEMLEGQLGASVVGIAVAYCFPDHSGAMEIARTRNLFAANCLVCAYFLCQCEGQKLDKGVVASIENNDTTSPCERNCSESSTLKS